MKGQTEERFTFITEAETTCICGKKVLTGKADGEYAMIHDLPQCALFMDLDPVDFLTYLRLHRSN